MFALVCGGGGGGGGWSVCSIQLERNPLSFLRKERITYSTIDITLAVGGIIDLKWPAVHRGLQRV